MYFIQKHNATYFVVVRNISNSELVKLASYLGVVFHGFDSFGNTIQSALDHIYISENLKERAKCEKLTMSSTDHVPIVAKISSKGKKVKHIYLQLLC